MTVIDESCLAKIVSAEGLDHPIIECDTALHQDAVVLRADEAGWTVFLVDERHQPIKSTIRCFSERSEALVHVLKKLRDVAAARSALRRSRKEVR